MSQVNTIPFVPGYNLLQQVGSGSYSTVYKAIETGSGEEVAIKCVLKSNLSPTGKKSIVTEIQIMKILNDKFILNLKDFYYDDCYVYLILDYCDGGDLSYFIKSKRRLSEKVCRKFMQQLVLGLKFLRSKNITHFDLKPQNLLLVTKPMMTIKIGDFGLSGFLSEEAHANVLKGSPLYMAPEILLGKPVDPKADLWSVGVIFYECFFGEAPLAHSNCKQLVRTLTAGVAINIPPGLSDAAQDLLKRLLIINPEDRISFEDLFSHPFLDLEHYPTDESYLKAVSLARKAVQLDYDKNYIEAFNMYCTSLNYLVPFLSTALPPEKGDFVRKKVDEYLQRAEQLKSVLYKAKECIDNSGSTSKRRSFPGKEVTVPTVRATPSGPSTEVASAESEVTSVPFRAINQLTLVQQDAIPEEESREIPVDSSLGGFEGIKALKSMCSSTPKLQDAIEIGLTAQLYLYEGNYRVALDNFKMCLNVIVPLLEYEPQGQRRVLLTKMTKEWLKEAESAEALIAAVEGAANAKLGQPEESCVIQ